jgi:cell division protein FtsI/penicillin-binding protein 2
MIIAMDPNNGEMLAMASLPSYDPNILVQGQQDERGQKADRCVLAGPVASAL